MDQVAVDTVAEYAGEDADATWRIEQILSAKVKSEGLWTLYAELERPLISVLARMERSGIAIDAARLKQLSSDFAARMTAIETQVYSMAGHTFNINSGPQLRQVLFDELKLPSLAEDARRRAEHRPGRARGAGAKAPLPCPAHCSTASSRSSRARIWMPCPSWSIRKMGESMLRSTRASRRPAD